MAYIPLTIYRELVGFPPDLQEWLDVRNQIYEVEDPEGKTHWFVDDDQPRDSDITDDIIKHTSGFALFAETDDGPEFVASYRKLTDAIAARLDAKVTISAPEVEVESAPGWNSLNGTPTEPERTYTAPEVPDEQ